MARRLSEAKMRSGRRNLGAGLQLIVPDFIVHDQYVKVIPVHCSLETAGVKAQETEKSKANQCDPNESPNRPSGAEQRVAHLHW